MNAKEMLRSKGMLLGLGVVLGAAILGGGGYALYQHIWGDNLLSNILPSAGTKLQGLVSTPTTTSGQSVSVTSTPTPTADPYAGWSTAQATSYSVKYPTGWYTQAQMGITTVNNDETDLSSENVKLPTLISKQGIFCGVSRLSTLYPEDAESIALHSPAGQFQVGGLHGPNTVWTKLANVTISGASGAFYSVDSSGDGTSGQNYALNYILPKGAEYFLLSCAMNKSVASTYTNTVTNIANSIVFNN